MDWNAAIERNREALKRVLATLVAMAGLAGLTSPLAGEDGSARRGKAEALAEPGGGYLSAERPTLSRHLHRAVLRLLRPAEAAARRLIIVIARDLVVPPLGPQRPRKPSPASPPARKMGRKSAFLSNGVGTGIVMLGNVAPPADLRPPAPRALSLPLTDRLPRWRGPGRPRPSGVPRISFPGFSALSPIPVRRPPSPSDPVDAARLSLRLAALASALDDLPKYARRFARWRCRVAAGAQNKESREHGLVRRVSPLRPGRPPGQSAAASRRPAHEVHDVLSDLQYFAFKALERPDTS